MKPVDPFEFPPEQMAAYKRARRLEYFTLVYIGSAALFLYLTMGNSQAMRTSWLEDMISLVPALAFLITTRVARLPARSGFPYGFHSAISIGHLTASLALLVMGLFLLGEAVLTLATGERPSIGGFTIFGHTVWAGWPMLAALAYTGIPSFFLGRAKARLAPQINDKILHADADMMKADWMFECATAIGVVGIGFGFWWMDGAAAAIVSANIVRDGIVNLSAAVADLIDEAPRKTTDRTQVEPVPQELARYLESFPWVEKAEVRMRDEGHVLVGEAFIVPRRTDDLVDKIADLTEKAKSYHWRIRDLVVMPVTHAELSGIDKGMKSNSAPHAGLDPATFR
ncbi:cation diffusion facilitator family transporter [Microvirga brassicacearum]|uniref:Cation transporter n=1 Tax=Microvirga brassicacearum TaxID=2580413 RepID=A0A5N3PI97_9HYPH|nr:cation transporter [Microvirga brassicacearum]KAB0269457.1 cation transporter [Microvirga brassicacearum]